jgi:aspartyl-tRNA(Asn)/glutamyl-tRNA(Gln) amidotransferase subunit A
MLSTLHPPRSLSSRFPRYISSLPVTLCTLTAQSPPSQILSIRHALLSRHVTATQLAESYLTRLRLTEPHLRSFLHLSDAVSQQASRIDEQIAGNEQVGPLAGVLVAVKDNICTADMPSTGGSRVLEGYRPPFDATAVRKIKELGGIVVGKTNLDEFGMGSTTEGSAFQVLKFYHCLSEFSEIWLVFGAELGFSSSLVTGVGLLR